ncbi:hypothetical protein [Thiorhodococcus mannitoliphagus]|uniref:hypothetical protein n=1 Tax=Thiorhodococcus mannitoliphagus TaxID=329406 RepID=UPI001F0E35EA|nr:hypothetical protein [Thiorhodococcus mannitoliphagus]
MTLDCIDPHFDLALDMGLRHVEFIGEFLHLGSYLVLKVLSCSICSPDDPEMSL